MRIIGGKLKGKQIRTCRGLVLRPTSGKVRETIFDILGPSLAGGSVLDLFAGTGALGIEALSRGMDRSVFIENNPRVMNILQKNITACDLENRTETLKCTVSKGLSILRLREDRFEIVFLDPPYRKKLIGKTLGEISNAHLLKKDGLVIAEHASNEAVEATYGTLKLDDQRQYGETAVSFFIQ